MAIYGGEATFVTGQSARRASILNDSPSLFLVASRTDVNPEYGAWREWSYLGRAVVEKYDDLIVREATLQGVDADLVRSIIYMEVSHGGIYGYPAELAGKADSIYPMNIRESLWADLIPDGGELTHPGDNIAAGVRLIKEIQDRVTDPSVTNIASLYYDLGANVVQDYGARVDRIYQQRLWSSDELSSYKYYHDVNGHLKAVEIRHQDGNKTLYLTDERFGIVETRFDASGHYLGGSCYAGDRLETNPNIIFNILVNAIKGGGDQTLTKAKDQYEEARWAISPVILDLGKR